PTTLLVPYTTLFRSHGESAIIADTGPDADAEQTGRAMASAVRCALGIGLARLSAGAYAAAHAFSIERHLDRVEAILDQTAAAPRSEEHTSELQSREN